MYALLAVCTLAQLPGNLQRVVDYHNTHAREVRDTLRKGLAKLEAEKPRNQTAIDTIKTLVDGITAGTSVLYPSLKLPVERNDVGWLFGDKVKVKLLIDKTTVVAEVTRKGVAPQLLLIETADTSNLEEEQIVDPGTRPFIVKERRVAGRLLPHLKRFTDGPRLLPHIRPLK